MLANVRRTAGGLLDLSQAVWVIELYDLASVTLFARREDAEAVLGHVRGVNGRAYLANLPRP